MKRWTIEKVDVEILVAVFTLFILPVILGATIGFISGYFLSFFGALLATGLSFVLTFYVFRFEYPLGLGILIGWIVFLIIMWGVRLVALWLITGMTFGQFFRLFS